MEIRNLTRENKGIIIEELREVFLSSLMLGLVLLFLYVGSYLFYFGDYSNGSYQGYYFIYIILLIVGLLLFLGWVFYRMRIPMMDLFKGKKKIRGIDLIGKEKKEKFGYHLNRIVDSQIQPVLYEYYLNTEERSISVNRETYDLFEAGDFVFISELFYSGKIVEIEKSIEAG